MIKCFSRIFLLGFIIVCCSNCANIIPPTGGAKDTLAPILMSSLPKDSTLNFKAKRITLTFNEFVEAKDISQNLVVNPLPNNLPNVDYKLQNVFIDFRDSLEPNTTYTINFGNAIKDVNEGNIYNNKIYIFSTGNTIDNKTITGNVLLAQDGKIDSTLVAILHSNLSDSSIKKNKPKYLAKLDGKGNFKFTNLPNATFNLFIVPNDFSKKYDDSTKLFAFLNKSIKTTDSITNFKLLAYKQSEFIEKKSTIKSTVDNDAKLSYTSNILANKYDILDTAIVFTFNKKITSFNKNEIQLVDSNFKKIDSFKIEYDSANTSFCIKLKLNLDTKYYLIFNKTIVQDEKKMGLAKIDSISFTTLAAKDYGTIKITNKTTITNAVIQIVSNNKIVDFGRFSNKEFNKVIFKPGEYELRILLDENKNNIWDAGNYSLKKQPEKVLALSTKLIVKPNYENEVEVSW